MAVALEGEVELFKFFHLPDELPDTKTTADHLFGDNTLLFKNPSDFNDPFDSSLFFDISLKDEKKIIDRSDRDFKNRLRTQMRKHGKKSTTKNLMKLVVGSVPTPRQLVEQHQEDVRVCCFIGVPPADEAKFISFNSLLMWSHYANSHHGFLVKFRKDPKNELLKNAYKIMYSDKQPSINYNSLNEFTKYADDKKIDESKTHEIVRPFLTKATCWSYENEYRLVENFDGENVARNLLLQIDNDSIDSIYLGCRIDAKFTKKIISYISKYKNKPSIFQMEKSDREYKLNILKIKI